MMLKKFEDDVRPRLDDAGVPWCSQEACPSFDGKRCRALGFRPDAICEPAVRELQKFIDHVEWAE